VDRKRLNDDDDDDDIKALEKIAFAKLYIKALENIVFAQL